MKKFLALFSFFQSRKTNAVKFHLNDPIKVRLKPAGYKLLADHWNNNVPNPEDFGGPVNAEYFKGKADADGYTKFAAWDFMKKFGPHCVIGTGDHFHLEIIIEKTA